MIFAGISYVLIKSGFWIELLGICVGIVLQINFSPVVKGGERFGGHPYSLLATGRPVGAANRLSQPRDTVDGCEILQQLIGGLSHCLWGFSHPRWCRMSLAHMIVFDKTYS